MKKESCQFRFETGKKDKNNRKSYYFRDPVKVIKLTDPAKTKDYFKELESLSKKYYLAGFFSYELGYLLEEKFPLPKRNKFPYALFCAFSRAEVRDEPKENRRNESYKISNLRLSIPQKVYRRNLRKIKDYIRAGDTYQVNYTMKYKFGFSGSPAALYEDLKKKQNVAYNVFAQFGETSFLSLSPELFFRKNGKEMLVRPMKGTVKRGINIEEDIKNKSFLKTDLKNRSENLMIVDLLRNDLGRIAETGSVRTRSLFDVEAFNSLFQMTSDISARLKRNIPLYDVFKSLFPCGSVTGAPKIRSMEIIRELETEPRGIYTGGIGFFMPGGKAVFNVAIRTLLIEKNKGEMGIGGGIVADSGARDEYEECKLKGLFLTKKREKDFQLIETLPFQKTYRYLNLHLKRMKESALYCEYPFNRLIIIELLDRLKKRLNPDFLYKIRILLNRNGVFKVTHEKIKHLDAPFRITVSTNRINSCNWYQYFKTTNREFYNREWKKAQQKGYYDTIFLNEKNQVAEGAVTNVYAEKNGIIYTPPIECGILDGTIRQVMLKKKNVKEKILRISDLKKADAVYISNSVIGFRKAKLI